MGRRGGGAGETALCGLLVVSLMAGRAWAQAPRGTEPGLEALAEGQEAFDALDMERALAQLERARLLLSAPGHAPLRSQAWALKVAAQRAQGDVAGAQQEAQRLLAVDPAVHFSPDHFPPEALAQLERLRQEARAAAVLTAGEASLPLPLGEGRGEGLRQHRAPPPEAQEPASRRVGLGLLAAGVLLLGGGAVLGLKAAGRREALAPLAQNDARAPQLRADGRRLALLADVSAVTGLLSAAGGAALTLLRPRPPRPPEAQPPAPPEADWSAGGAVALKPAPSGSPPPEAPARPRPLDEEDLRNH